MKNLLHPFDRRDSGIGYLCLALFSVFSFVWLYSFQGFLLGHEYESLIAMYHGIPGNFNRFLMAFLLTAFLDFLAMAVRLLPKVSGYFFAIDYLPSSLILGVVTSCDGNGAFKQSACSWIIVLLIIIPVFTSAALVRTRSLIRPDNKSLKTVINLLISVLWFAVVALLGNTDENLHRRLLVENLYNNGKYEQVLSQGKGEEETDIGISMMRVQSMLLLESEVPGSGIGNLLFKYPVPLPGPMSSMLMEMAGKDSANCYQLSLASDLLNRNLDGFHKSFDVSLYNNKVVPLYYLQALVMIGDTVAGQMTGKQFETEKENYAEFLSDVRKAEADFPEEVGNATFVKWHTSYYWFYNFR